LVFLLAQCVLSPAYCQIPGVNKLQDIQTSHIQANVPEADDFDKLLTESLIKYFRTSVSDVSRVDYELLRPRQSPTQAGVSWPKYYAWVRVYQTGNRFAVAGAVRLAAIDKTFFRITHFLKSSEICADPTKVGEIFPAPLCLGIVNRAKATGADL
jgi:hypothetical protein